MKISFKPLFGDVASACMLTVASFGFISETKAAPAQQPISITAPLNNAAGNQNITQSAQLSFVRSYFEYLGYTNAVYLDKNRAHSYIVQNGQIAFNEASIFGKNRGDDNFRAAGMSTGAGFFPILRVMIDEHHRPYFVFQEGNRSVDVYAIHDIVPGREDEFATPQISDNRMSNGCVNQTSGFINKLFELWGPRQKTFTNNLGYNVQGNVFIVLPETESETRSVFNIPDTFRPGLFPKSSGQSALLNARAP